MTRTCATAMCEGRTGRIHHLSVLSCHDPDDDVAMSPVVCLSPVRAPVHDKFSIAILRELERRRAEQGVARQMARPHCLACAYLRGESIESPRVHPAPAEYRQFSSPVLAAAASASLGLSPIARYGGCTVGGGDVGSVRSAAASVLSPSARSSWRSVHTCGRASSEPLPPGRRTLYSVGAPASPCATSTAAAAAEYDVDGASDVAGAWQLQPQPPPRVPIAKRLHVARLLNVGEAVPKVSCTGEAFSYDPGAPALAAAADAAAADCGRQVTPRMTQLI